MKDMGASIRASQGFTTQSHDSLHAFQFDRDMVKGRRGLIIASFISIF